MAVDLFSDPEGLFVRLGRIGHVLYALNQFQSEAAAAYLEVGDQYPDTLRDVVAAVNQTIISSVKSATAAMGQLPSLAAATLVRMVTDDQPTLPASLPACINELITQMRSSLDAVAACDVTAVATEFTAGNVGDGVLVITTKRGDGLVHENMFEENAKIICTADSYTLTATEDSEPFTFRGESAGSASPLDYNWPEGSGANRTISPATPSVNTVLVNGGFETWSSNAASYWTAAVGAWNTNYLQSSTAHGGTYSVRFAAGGTLSAFYQQFNSASTGTGSRLSVWTSYAVNFWLRTVTGTASTGVLVCELVDDSGTVINDEQGAANTFSVDLTTLTTSWAAFSGIFRLPRVPPAVVRMRMRLSTAIASADVLLDDLVMTPMIAAYQGGPAMALFPGATAFAINDGWDIATTNGRNGQDFLATWQALFDRLFGMRQMGLVLPSSGSATVDDTLITY